MSRLPLENDPPGLHAVEGLKQASRRARKRSRPAKADRGRPGSLLKRGECAEDGRPRALPDVHDAAVDKIASGSRRSGTAQDRKRQDLREANIVIKAIARRALRLILQQATYSVAALTLRTVARGNGEAAAAKPGK